MISIYYIVSKLFTFLLFPPGIIVVLLLYAFLKIKDKTRYIFLISSITIWVLSTKLGAFLLMYPLERLLIRENQSCKKFHTIVVLGGGAVKDSPNLPLYPESLKRFIYGLLVAKNIKGKILFTGGGITSYKEAKGARETLKDLKNILNFNPDIILESKSLNTIQNAKYTKELLKTKEIILITSAYHSFRSKMTFEMEGFKVCLKPTDYKMPETIEFDIWFIFPRFYFFRISYKAIREYIGILYLLFLKIL